MKFCRNISEMGHPIHVHAHFNRGQSDDHIPLVQAYEAGLFASSWFCPRGLLAEIRNLHGLCGDHHMVLENPLNEDAFFNFRWAKDTIAPDVSWVPV